jgi:GT2 family glycosyltransferase
MLWLRRQTIDRVGLFDTALDVGTPSNGGGDLDIFHRVLVAGLTIRYEPAALMWHYHRRKLACRRRSSATSAHHLHSSARFASKLTIAA